MKEPFLKLTLYICDPYRPTPALKLSLCLSDILMMLHCDSLCFSDHNVTHTYYYTYSVCVCMCVGDTIERVLYWISCTMSSYVREDRVSLLSPLHRVFLAAALSSGGIRVGLASVSSSLITIAAWSGEYYHSVSVETLSKQDEFCH